MVRLLCFITPTVFVATASANILMAVVTFFNGFFLATEDTGWWFRWISYCSYTQWLFRGLVLNQYDGMTFANGTIDGLDYIAEAYSITDDPSYKWVVASYNWAITFVAIVIGYVFGGSSEQDFFPF